MSQFPLLTHPGYYNDLELPITFESVGYTFLLTSDGQVTATSRGTWVPTRLSINLHTGECFLDLDSLDSPSVGELCPGVPFFGLPEIVAALDKKNKLFK